VKSKARAQSLYEQARAQAGVGKRQRPEGGLAAMQERLQVITTQPGNGLPPHRLAGQLSFRQMGPPPTFCNY
jgi:hypothetical protein